MMRVEGAFILSQLCLITATESTGSDNKGFPVIRQIRFLPAVQNTPPTVSVSVMNGTAKQQQLWQQNGERRYLEEQRHRIFRRRYHRRREAETLLRGGQLATEGSAAQPLIRFPAVTLLRAHASNESRSAAPVNNSALQNIALAAGRHQNSEGVLPNRTRVKEEETSDSDNNNDDDDYNDDSLDNNLVDIELEVRRKMERTTIGVRSYPPVTEPISPPSTKSVTTDLEIVTPLPIVISTLPPFIGDHSDAPIVSNLGFGPRTTIPYTNFSSSASLLVQKQKNNFKVFQEPDFFGVPEITPPPVVPAPIAVPVPAAAPETSFNHFSGQFQNFEFGQLPPEQGHFRNSGRRSENAGSTGGGVLDQRQLPQQVQVQVQAHQNEPVDDVLGCTWDIVTNSCKDLFYLKLCSHCHDFGNIFLHNCKCLAKYSTAL